MNLDEKSPTFFDDFFAEKLKGKKRRNGNQHNDNQHNDSQHNGTQHNNTLPLCWILLCWVPCFIYMLNVVLLCHYAECCYAECLGATTIIMVTLQHSASNYAECYILLLCWVSNFDFYAECRYAECRCAKCRGAKKIGTAGWLTPSNTCSSLNLMSTCQRVPHPFDIILITFLQASNPKTALATHPVIGVNEVGSLLHLSSSKNN